MVKSTIRNYLTKKWYTETNNPAYYSEVKNYNEKRFIKLFIEAGEGKGEQHRDPSVNFIKLFFLRR